MITTYDLLLRDEHFGRAVVPDLVLRFGEMPTCKPLRAWLAACGADQIVVDPERRLERAEPPGGGDPARRPDRAGRGLGGAAGGSRRDERWTAAELAASAADEAARRGDRRRAGDGRADHRAGPAPARSAAPTATATSSTPPRACRSATRRPSCRPGEADVLFLCNRGANGIDGLISSGIGAAHASGRPTTIVTGDLGLLHDIGGLAALREVSTPVRIVVIDNDGGGIFHFLPQEEALGRRGVRGPARAPRAASTSAAAAALFDLPHRRLESLDELPEALAAGTGLIEVPVDRRQNVAAHRETQRRRRRRPGRARNAQQGMRPASRPGPGSQAAPK